jgi:oligopeptide/dipeptide ABC transporter ATP-binding protein
MLVSHNVAVVEELCEDTAVMHVGQIVERGPTGVPLTGPARPYTVALRSAAPRSISWRAENGSCYWHSPRPADPPPACRFHTRCPIAIDVCRKEEPPLRPIGTGRVGGVPPGR